MTYHDYLNLNGGASTISQGRMVFRPGIELFGAEDCLHGFEFFCFRSPEMTVEMNNFLALVKGRRRLLDVGALHGVFTLSFLKLNPDALASAIEPSPKAFPKLLANARANDVIHRMTLHNCALSEAATTLSMYLDWEHLVMYKTADGPLAEVIAVTGDSLIVGSEVTPPDTIKIDVEGHEMSVLKGLSGTIRACRPLVFLELHPKFIARQRGDKKYLRALFEPLGYTVRHCTGELVSFEQLERDSWLTRYVLFPPGS